MSSLPVVKFFDKGGDKVWYYQMLPAQTPDTGCRATLRHRPSNVTADSDKAGLSLVVPGATDRYGSPATSSPTIKQKITCPRSAPPP